MERTISISGRYVQYLLRRNIRSRSPSISIRRDGSVVLTIPKCASESIGEFFVRQNAKWLIKQIEYFDQFEDKSLARLGKRDYVKHKDKAIEIIKKRVEYFSAVYGFSYNKVSVRNQRTCWGSCTSKGNLSFNYKIIFLDDYLRDYVIVHELCHLKELNHSKRFWDLVSVTVPDHKEVRKKLNKIL